VEVLVPAARRNDILSQAAEMRTEHRQRKERLQRNLDEVIVRYGVRLLDNIDLTRLPDLERKAKIVANALMERGDARAYAVGRQMLSEIGQ
jgi:ABC-type enterochelin transport system substrate-binding protein